MLPDRAGIPRRTRPCNPHLIQGKPPLNPLLKQGGDRGVVDSYVRTGIVFPPEEERYELSLDF